MSSIVGLLSVNKAIAALADVDGLSSHVIAGHRAEMSQHLDVIISVLAHQLSVAGFGLCEGCA